MPENHVLDRLESRMAALSPQMKKAARFIIKHPEEVALHSMRGVAARARLHPNVFLRLAREVGFDSYEPFRSEFKDWIISRRHAEWTSRAQRIRQQPAGGLDPINAYVEQEIDNLRASFSGDTAEALGQSANLVKAARQLYVLGLRSLFPISFYFHYVSRMFSNKTVLLTGTGGTFADDLRNVSSADVLLAFSHQPYANDTVRAVAFARERGARTIIVTDSELSPVIGDTGVNIIVSNSGHSLFPTLLPTLAVAQVLVTLLVASGSDETLAAIEQSERQLNRFGVYVR